MLLRGRPDSPNPGMARPNPGMAKPNPKAARQAMTAGRKTPSGSCARATCLMASRYLLRRPTESYSKPSRFIWSGA